MEGFIFVHHYRMGPWVLISVRHFPCKECVRACKHLALSAVADDCAVMSGAVHSGAARRLRKGHAAACVKQVLQAVTYGGAALQGG